jgi:hypothetical protein
MKTTPFFMLFVAVLFYVGLLPAVAGPQETITKELKLSGFDRLQIGSAFTISVTKGDSFSVKVSGEREKVADVTAQVRNSELVVAFKENNSRLRLGGTVVRVEIVMPSLRGVNFGGTSASVVHEGFETDNFVAYVTGTAKSEIHMKSREVFADLTGSSSLELIGSSQKLKATIEGASGLNGLAFEVEDANLDANGTSVARVNVSGAIQVKASGASTIRYKGDPQIKSQEIARLSSFKKL